MQWQEADQSRVETGSGTRSRWARLRSAVRGEKDRQVQSGRQGYLTGLGLAILLTATLSWHRSGMGASIPVALVVLAMGVHLVFLLHITSGPVNTNNVLALAFGVLIVILLMGGSLWIMDNLNHNMVPMDQIMQMQR